MVKNYLQSKDDGLGMVVLFTAATASVAGALYEDAAMTKKANKDEIFALCKKGKLLICVGSEFFAPVSFKFAESKAYASFLVNSESALALVQTVTD